VLGWRAFFTVVHPENRILILDSGFGVDAPSMAGVWEPASKLTLTEAGSYQIGLLLAITPDAAQTLQAACNRQSPLDNLPIPFLNLCTVSAR